QISLIPQDNGQAVERTSHLQMTVTKQLLLNAERLAQHALSVRQLILTFECKGQVAERGCYLSMPATEELAVCEGLSQDCFGSLILPDRQVNFSDRILQLRFHLGLIL